MHRADSESLGANAVNETEPMEEKKKKWEKALLPGPEKKSCWTKGNPNRGNPS